MSQMRFLNNGNVVNEELLTKIVGIQFHEASQTLKVGQIISVRPIEVEGFRNVLGCFNSNGEQVGNIIANKGISELEFEAFGGKVFRNVDLINDVEHLTFRVKRVGRFGAVLTASF